VERAVVRIGVVTVLLSLGFAATLAQSTPLNDTQQKLLSLEAEAKPFLDFGATMAVLGALRLSSALPQSQLAPAQETASSLVPLAKKLQADALAVSGQLYLKPGVELDADMMYRTSAWELHVYFATWLLILDRVVRATATSPADTWKIDLLGSSYEQSRLYRILGNQQYELEHSTH
jgi:hypothetical protein